MSSDLPSYGLGATLINVGLSATVQVSPAAHQNGGFFKIASGGGTLAIVSGLSAVASSGYPVGSGEAISISGPAVFFLAAAGATMVVAWCPTLSQGWQQGLP